MAKIFSPLVWEESDSKEVILEKLNQMNQASLISGIEVNLVNFFKVFDFKNPKTKTIIKSLNKPLMGVCGLESKGDSMNQEEKIDHFIWALELGVPLIVIEYTSNFKEYIETALAKIKEAVPFFENKKNLVIEYASFKETPDYEKAKTIVENMFKYSPFLIKLITMANQASDNKIFYRILETYPKQKIIAFGMGDTGLESRINSVHHGSYATYGHFGISSQACPGQIYFKDLADEIAKENV